MTADGPVTSRQFLAHPPSWASKISSPDQMKGVSRYFVYGMVAFVVLSALLPIPFLAFGFETALVAVGTIFLLVVMVGGGVAVLVFKSSAARSQSRRILICVTNRALTVDERPGVAYSFLGAKLGTWGMTGSITMGAALHLQSGMHRLILGGRDHRLSAGTRLGAPDVGFGLPVDIDAWVSASDFDEILDVAGLRSRLDVRPPASGSPTRCLLFPNLFLYQKKGLLAAYKIQQFAESCNQPILAIDVGAEAIWVIDPNSNALIASAWRAQAAATPATYVPSFGSLYGGRGREYSIAPQMVVSGASLPPLTIACLDVTLGDFYRRFSWRGKVQVVRDPADYSVSGADWLTLVGTFGLAAYLEERV